MIVPFTKAEGADLHVEPMGRSLLEQRMYDWLDDTLAAQSLHGRSGADNVEAWHDLFIASAGAAAALSGLIFVAVSINLGEIFAAEEKIGSSYLTGRALESLVALLITRAISIVGLDATISRAAFAVVLLVLRRRFGDLAGAGGGGVPAELMSNQSPSTYVCFSPCRS